MKIILAGQSYLPGNNGQAVFTIHLAETLAQFGHQVTMIVPATTLKTKKYTHKGVEVLEIAAIHLPMIHDNTYISLAPHATIKRYFEQMQPDVVHLQDHYPLCRSVAKVANQLQVPIMGTNHFLPENVFPYLPIPKSWHPRAKRMLWQNVRSLYDHLDFITAPTETAANIVRAQGFSVPIEAASCGVDLKHFYPMPDINRAEMRQRYGLSSDKIITLFVGRVDAEKRLDVIIRALHKLQRSDLQFGIAGKGEHAPKLKALAERLGISAQVIFLGFVPDEDLPTLLNSIDIFAMPSEAELQSIATLEAMACGKPLLAADARALPELVESGKNGELFEASNVNDAAKKLAHLADNAAQWQSMGAIGIERAKVHSLENAAHRYEEIYYRLTSNLKAQKVGSQGQAGI